jgi:hypothetical protein
MNPYARNPILQAFTPGGALGLDVCPVHLMLWLAFSLYLNQATGFLVMESDNTPDPLQAIRDQAAKAMSRLDLASEQGQAMAQGALELESRAQEMEARRDAAREELRARREAARVSTAHEWVVLGLLALLAVVSACAIVWIVFGSDFPREARVASVPVVLSTWVGISLKVIKGNSTSPQAGADGDLAGEETEGRIAALRDVVRRLRDRLG